MARASVVELPHDDAAERAILGAVLIDNSLWSIVSDLLRPEDLYREDSRIVYSAMGRCVEGGSALDPIALADQLRKTNQLDRVGGVARLGRLLDGVPKSANVGHYIRIVQEKARRRAIMQAAEQLQTAAANGLDEENMQNLLSQLQIIAGDTAPLWTRSSLEAVADPRAGDVPYVIEGFLPAGDTTVIGATWKSGKSLIAYRIALDIMLGHPVFGSLAVREPLPIAIFQLEMPAWEDERRLRRLAIGAGIPPENMPRFAAEGHLTVFNRPAMNLTSPEGAARFCRAVRACGARVVVIDSLIAAFSGSDLNDNSNVRALFTRAFGPLTSEGITILALHHHRKHQTGGRNPDDRSALLGAQAFGAAAGRVYKLERLGKEDDPQADRDSFRLKLSPTGSWTPGAAEDLILSVHDTEEGGTVITLLTEAEQIRRGGATARQRAAITLARLVAASPGIERKASLEEVQSTENVSLGTVKGALSYARGKGWVAVVHPEARRNNQAVLMPGPAAQELP